MRLLWLCNTQPGVVREDIEKKPRGGVNWVDHVLASMRSRGEELRLLCPGDGRRGQLDRGFGYATFREGKPYLYSQAQEAFFEKELRDFSPDVIHIWGTEYGHTLAMVNAVEAAGALDKCVISIQGLCSVLARHYTEGIPARICKGFTFRDLLRQDNIRQQQKKFARRGELEKQALSKARHVIGRTDWDRACTLAINPERMYHFCNETLRQSFYQGQWRYGGCQKHRIFASSRDYPIKGFHYLLEAMAQVIRRYPDAVLAVTGPDYRAGGLARDLRREGYARYLRDLTRQLGLEGRVECLGDLNAEEMKKAYLEANVFVLPSTVENSPNSLGEAMLLGVPCVASCVGGVQSMLRHGSEGIVYPSTEPYMLADAICRLFEMETQAEELGRMASAHARATHDPEKNLDTLLEIYRSLG